MLKEASSRFSSRLQRKKGPTRSCWHGDRTGPSGGPIVGRIRRPAFSNLLVGVMLATGLVIAAATYLMFEKPTTDFLKGLIEQPRRPASVTTGLRAAAVLLRR